MFADCTLFRAACGAGGPLRLEWSDAQTGEPVRQDFERPVIVVGRSRKADLIIDHPLVGKRHAYLQVVDGRLYAVDLGSREGLRWNGVPRHAGWADRSRPVQVGPATVRVVDDDRPVELPPGPGPTSRRYESPRQLPTTVLDFRGQGGEPRQFTLNRVLSLVGSSERCHVRLAAPASSKVVCGLVRTPAGVWAVDLLSSQGIAVNGVPCREARLEDGDLLRLGTLTVRVTYGGPARPSRPDAPAPPAGSTPTAGSELLGITTLLPALFDRPEVLFSEAALRPLLEQSEPSPELVSSPFGQALILLIRLLGTMHHDHLKLVRDELEQIRRINHDITDTRAGLARPTPGNGVRPPSADTTPEHATAKPGSKAPQARVVDPEAVQMVVGERLATWEQERRGHWQKVIELLVRP